MDNPETIKNIILAAGLFSSSFGALVLFSERFRDFMLKTFWRGSEFDDKLFPGNSGYVYDRYVTGGTSLFVGLVLLALYFFSV